jgi:hypothetical protein
MASFASGDALRDELNTGIDVSVEELLARLSIMAPPVDAARIAQRVGCRAACAPPGRTASQRGSRRMFKSQRESTEYDRQRAVAADLGRWLMPRILMRERISCDESAPDFEIRMAAQFAARLLLPTRWFREDVRSMGYDLDRLQTRYGTATREMVAWRLLDLEAPLVVTIFDNNHLVARRSNILDGKLTAPTSAELSAQSYAHTYSRPGIERSAGMTARSWPLHRADWRREIVLALLDTEAIDLAD